MSEDLRARIANLEQQVDWLFQQAGYAPPNGTVPANAGGQGEWPYPVSPQVVEMIRAGRMIEAIKQVRAETGLGLAEAKGLADRTRAML